MGSLGINTNCSACCHLTGMWQFTALFLRKITGTNEQEIVSKKKKKNGQ